QVPSANIGAVTPQRSAATAVVKPFKGVPPASVPTLVAYDVSRFMRTGQNTIRIHVRCEFGVAAVLAEGYTEVPGGGAKSFSTTREGHVGEQMTDARSTGKATVLGSYGMEPWSVLPQVAADPQLVAAWDLRTPLERVLTIVLIEISVIWLWLTAASWLQRKRQWSHEQGLDVCALLHLPTLAALMLLWLLSYDVRFSNTWCFTPWVVFAAFALLLVTHLFLVLRGGPEANALTLPGTGNV